MIRTFIVTRVVDQPVFVVAFQSNGKVLVGGAFTTVTGVPRRGIARVNNHGSLDYSFDPGLGVEGNDGGVYAMAVYTNGTHIGKVVIAGSFTHFNRVVRFGIARLHPSGALIAVLIPAPASKMAQSMRWRFRATARSSWAAPLRPCRAPRAVASRGSI